MDETQLRRYLDDHRAGSDAALGVIARLRRRDAGTPVEALAVRLAAEIREERAVVDAVLQQLDAAQDPVRRAFGIAASLGRLASSLPFVPEPSLLEDLESLAVGVWGKRLLWGALGRVQEAEGVLEGLDFDRLSAMAEDQERDLLALRQDAVADVLDLAA